MKKFILDYVNRLEGYKTAIKSLHWNSRNLSQHKQCDEIADDILEFQDVVSEVEQSINGNLPFNQLRGLKYNVKNIKTFLDDVFTSTVSFYKKLSRRGDEYIGLKSECESFLTKIQRHKYLINFTLKEDFKRSFKNQINENRIINEGFEVNEDILYSALNEAFARVLKRENINEAFKSQKLRNTLSQARAAYHEPRSNNHSLRNLSTQGLGYSGDAEAPGYMKDKRHSMYSSNYLDQITDDMISDTGTRDELEKKGYRFGGHETLYGIGSQDVYDANGEKRYAIPANAGYYIILNNDESTKNKIQNLSSQAYKKYSEREDNRRYSDSDKQYYPMTPKAYAAREYRTNPYPWAKKNGSKDPENGWDNEARKNAMSNIRNGIDSQGIDPRKYVPRFSQQ